MTDPHGVPPGGTTPPAPHDDGKLGRHLAEAGSRPGSLDPSQLATLVRQFGASARRAGVRAVGSGRWFTDLVLEVAEHIPVRDLATLEDHHHGLTGPLLADAMIRSATTASAAVGAATGALATASELAPPTWAALPVELLVETAVVVAVELKLVAELHAVAGVPVGGSATVKGMAVATAWTTGRGIKPADLLGIAPAELMGRGARTELTRRLRRRLVARTGRNLGSLAPFLIGAGAGAALNRRATRAVGREVAGSLGLPLPR